MQTKSRATKPRTTPQERTAAQGLTVDEVGPIDAERLVAFLWQIAGRPLAAPSTWTRARPLVIALDNYSVCDSFFRNCTACGPAGDGRLGGQS